MVNHQCVECHGTFPEEKIVLSTVFYRDWTGDSRGYLNLDRPLARCLDCHEKKVKSDEEKHRKDIKEGYFKE